MIWGNKMTVVLKLDKLDTTPTNCTKLTKECDVGSLKRISKYLKKKKEMKDE